VFYEKMGKKVTLNRQAGLITVKCQVKNLWKNTTYDGAIMSNNACLGTYCVFLVPRPYMSWGEKRNMGAQASTLWGGADHCKVTGKNGIQQ
jgi:hypothetical protein